MRTITFLFRTQIDGCKQAIPVEARTIREARAVLATMLWPGETVLL